MLLQIIILLFIIKLIQSEFITEHNKAHNQYLPNIYIQHVDQAPSEHEINRMVNGIFSSSSNTVKTIPSIQTSFQQYNSERKCPGGICLPYYQCNNTNGEGFIDVRIGKADDCNYSEICCPDEDSSKFEPIHNHHFSSKTIQCGNRNIYGVGYKITDKNCQSQFGEFPWMVAVINEEQTIQKSVELSYLCGGALIHPQAILTSAHCVNDKNLSQLIIRAGEWNTKTINKLHPHQDRYVSEIVIHEKYLKNSLQNDIAILFVNQPIILGVGENVGTLCLPPQNFAFYGSKCVASGWRKHILGGNGNDEPILKKIEVPIVSRPACVKSLRETLLGNDFNLHDSLICAGIENRKDTYEGDGGSILVCPIPGTMNRYYHTGIIAWKIEGGENQVPDVYVNVAIFKNWIDSLFINRGLNLSYYTYIV